MAKKAKSKPARKPAPAARKAKPAKTMHPAGNPAPAVATEPDIKNDTITFERLGAVQTWKIPSAPYVDQKNLRIAYKGGFMARAQSWLGHVDGCPERFNSVTLQNAFEDGYNDAKRQEGAAATSKKKTLVGKPLEA